MNSDVNLTAIRRRTRLALPLDDTYLYRLGVALYGFSSINSFMTEEIKANAVYTTNETRDLLKISDSTIKRLLKKGILRANKVGGQYRILGKEILRLISPELEKKSTEAYLEVKKKAVDVINKW